MEKLRTVRGVHDLLPDILHKQNLVINEGLKISEKYCYQQIETPISVSYTHLTLPTILRV